MIRFHIRSIAAGAALLLLAAGLSWWQASARRRPHPSAPAPHARMMWGVVEPGRADEWTLRFTAGEPARVRVEGESGLGCAAQDASGTLVDVNVGDGVACTLRWVPARTGNYRVVMRNAGRAPIHYRLLVR